MSTATTTGYSSNQVLEQCPGITYRQLNYWCMLGLFGEHQRHMGSGRRRQFTSDDLAVFRALELVSGELDLAGERRNPLGTDIYRLIALQVRDGAEQVVVRLGDRVRIVVDLDLHHSLASEGAAGRGPNVASAPPAAPVGHPTRSPRPEGIPA
jgi:hypothetical protein